MASPPPTKPLKILMLHGFTQSGPLFRAKTRALEKNFQKAFPAGVTLHYPTGPMRLHPADLPADAADQPQDAQEEPDTWGWWRRKDRPESRQAGGTDEHAFTYFGIEDGLAHLADVLKKEGPFDGALGFSQGSCMAGMLASLLELGRRRAFGERYADGGLHFPESFIVANGNGGNERGASGKSGVSSGDDEDTLLIHPPLKFVVMYSGFAPTTHPVYRSFYVPKIRTPAMHFIGSTDTVVAEHRSLELVRACEGGGDGGRLVYHPGGHFVPSSQRQFVLPLIGFIREVTVASEGGEAVRSEKANQAAEESVEDMQMPF